MAFENPVMGTSCRCAGAPRYVIKTPMAVGKAAKNTRVTVGGGFGRFKGRDRASDKNPPKPDRRCI